MTLVHWIKIHMNLNTEALFNPFYDDEYPCAVHHDPGYVKVYCVAIAASTNATSIQNALVRYRPNVAN